MKSFIEIDPNDSGFNDGNWVSEEIYNFEKQNKHRSKSEYQSNERSELQTFENENPIHKGC